ncbi:hypothetical protein KC19_4G130100 [Ceratodon purpureus]|uniref:Lipoxygenase n=1 Tax=Ceratodon purpureus TaxID=3225 RepID=A0A8T0I866_CERPU|nr:hypothetical protein KC19_4G130100 [Ceratodon purpureus]
MAQVTVSASSFTVLNKADRASSLLKHNAFASPLVVSLPNAGKYRHRYPSIVVSRIADTTTTTTTTVTQNGGVVSDKTTIQPGTKSAAVIIPPSVTGFTTVGAVVTIVRKQRPSREERISNAVDVVSDLLGNRVFLQLVSEDVDPGTGVGRRSKETFIKDWAEKARVVADKVQYTAEFSINIAEFGQPGAILIRNLHQAEHYLESIALRLPSGTVYFPCHSYIAASGRDLKPRIFFTNQVYMPSETPAGIKDLREQELSTLRGNGKGKREEWERIYDYDVYNDLGDVDKDINLNRPILGGGEFKYPRRVRTGRDPAKADPTKESRQPGEERFGLYIPRDERFEPIKQTNFIANTLRGVVHASLPKLRDLFDETPGEFDAFRDFDKLYYQGLDVGQEIREEAEKKAGIPPFLKGLRANEEESLEMTRERNLFLDRLPIPDYVREVVRTSTTPRSLLRYPLPRVLSRDKFAWIRDDEFARQTLAGVNPVAIECVKEFPIKSALSHEYGPKESAIKSEHIEDKLEGMTAEEAVEAKRLFVVDYHDVFMPYVARINELEGRKIYAARALFYLHKDGFLRPVAIELSLPPCHPGAVGSQRVFTPGKESTSFWLWQLAKLHFLAVDSGHHQLISHWLRTHASTEPYVIATYRQLSELHPIAKLLHPHTRYTMEINAAARQNLVAANGVIETTFTPGKYAMEMSAVVYDALWRFDQEALPEDLIRRGMAERDESAPHGLRLRIEDYPYAADGLLVWDSIEAWIRDYVSLYYSDSATILEDVELQAWWDEIVTKGHADKKGEDWWPKLDSPQNLVRILTTIIWIASGHHAAVNFGQYDYTGFVPNQPCLARKLIPEQDDPEFERLLRDPHKFMLEMLPNQTQATTVMTVVSALSAHSPDEEYLGYSGNHTNWTSDERAVKAFRAFSRRLAEVDKKIIERNKDLKNKHRAGAGTLPYELLLQKSGPGITMRGVPNSISI